MFKVGDSVISIKKDHYAEGEVGVVNDIFLRLGRTFYTIRINSRWNSLYFMDVEEDKIGDYFIKDTPLNRELYKF